MLTATALMFNIILMGFLGFLVTLVFYYYCYELTHTKFYSRVVFADDFVYVIRWTKKSMLPVHTIMVFFVPIDVVKGMKGILRTNVLLLKRRELYGIKITTDSLINTNKLTWEEQEHLSVLRNKMIIEEVNNDTNN